MREIRKSGNEITVTRDLHFYSYNDKIFVSTREVCDILGISKNKMSFALVEYCMADSKNELLLGTKVGNLVSIKALTDILNAISKKGVTGIMDQESIAKLVKKLASFEKNIEVVDKCKKPTFKITFTKDGTQVIGLSEMFFRLEIPVETFRNHKMKKHILDSGCREGIDYFYGRDVSGDNRGYFFTQRGCYTIAAYYLQNGYATVKVVDKLQNLLSDSFRHQVAKVRIKKILQSQIVETSKLNEMQQKRINDLIATSTRAVALYRESLLDEIVNLNFNKISITAFATLVKVDEKQLKKIMADKRMTTNVVDCLLPTKIACQDGFLVSTEPEKNVYFNITKKGAICLLENIIGKIAKAA